MQRFVSVLVFAFTIGMSSPAWSLGSLGVKVGTGLGFTIPEDDPGGDFEAPNVTPATFGLTWTLGLMVAEVELDLLYMQTTTKGGTPSVAERTSHHLSIPAIAKLQLPIVPMLAGLQLGAGLGMRFNFDTDPLPGSTDDQEAMVYYVPVVIGADIDVQLARATAEIRYEHQMTDSVDGDGSRVHQLLFLLGASL